VITLGRDSLGKLAKIGLFYLSLIWGSIIIIFEVIILSLVATLSFTYLVVTNGIFSLILILIISSSGTRINLGASPSSETGTQRVPSIIG